MPIERPYYDKAFAALEAAHKACFNHPERDVLGMSHGPFSGVNEALGIVAHLEAENARLRSELKAATRVKVGDRVEKMSGYKWPGVVVATFSTTRGARRLVVECTVPEVAGALHIYSPEQVRISEPQDDHA